MRKVQVVDSSGNFRFSAKVDQSRIDAEIAAGNTILPDDAPLWAGKHYTWDGSAWVFNSEGEAESQSQRKKDQIDVTTSVLSAVVVALCGLIGDPVWIAKNKLARALEVRNEAKKLL